MKAKYKPQNPDLLPIKLKGCSGSTIKVTHARPVNGVPYYWPDLFFPGSSAIPGTDLEFDQKPTDVYCPKCSGICVPVFHLEGACL